MDILEKAINTPLSGSIDQVLGYEILRSCWSISEQSTKADEIHLARIELAVLPLFRYEKRPFKALYHQLARDPQFFIELVCLAYRASDEAPHEVSERETSSRTNSL